VTPSGASGPPRAGEEDPEFIFTAEGLLGLLPGVSRSGSTMTGGMATGLSRRAAAKFSFMMSAPAILGSFLMEGKDALEAGYYTEIEFLMQFRNY